MDAYFFIKIFKKYTYHRNLNKIKKKIFLKKWFKFFFSKIIIKKFNFLKKIFYKNVQKILKKKVNIVKYTLFFKNFLKYKNINFFFFLQFNLTNIIKYSYFFFHSFFLKKYITHLGIYINGCLHKNMNYLLSYNNNYNVQFIWTFNFFYYYIFWYKFYFFLKSFFKKFQYLYYFRKYVQKKSFINKIPKWYKFLISFKWYIVYFLEISHFILSFSYIPINLYFYFFFFKYINIYNHRIYLWKYLI